MKNWTAIKDLLKMVFFVSFLFNCHSSLSSSVQVPKSYINDQGEKQFKNPENLTTWIFEDGTFVPMAKLQGDKSYSIITDHLGTPTEAYDEEGKKVWARELGIYGQTRNEFGTENFIPFLYQGQYLDSETELAYNRFRYYSPESGAYVSQDPIRLRSKEGNFYSYSREVNVYVDVFGLSSFDPFAVGEITEFPQDLHFGQDRISPTFSDIGSQASDDIRGRAISDVAADLSNGEISPDEFVISYTADPKTGKAVTLNNRGLAAISESGKFPTHAIHVPYDDVPNRLVKDIKNRPPSKSINITRNKDGSGFIRNVTNCG